MKTGELRVRIVTDMTAWDAAMTRIERIMQTKPETLTARTHSLRNWLTRGPWYVDYEEAE